MGVEKACKYGVFGVGESVHISVHNYLAMQQVLRSMCE